MGKMEEGEYLNFWGILLFETFNFSHVNFIGFQEISSFEFNPFVFFFQRIYVLLNQRLSKYFLPFLILLFIDDRRIKEADEPPNLCSFHFIIIFL